MNLARTDRCLTERGPAMMSLGLGIFLQVPGESKERILHRGTIVEGRGDCYTAEFEDQELSPELGQEVVIYRDIEGTFMKQAARIDAVLTSEHKHDIRFEVTGQPVSAETRECYRVSTVTTGLTAKLGPEDCCPLLNVSATGFAVVATGCYNIGEVVPAILDYEDQQYTGRARIQSIRDLNGGRIRYGLHLIDGRRAGGTLKKGVLHITMSVQRQHLRHQRRCG